jgi:3-hydroxyisobutyrate dehydrogenase-like beta-hydroxyacid dehydrogenase
VTVGLLHPGEMGSALGAVLATQGVEVVWASTGRSDATRDRADAAGLRDVETVAELASASDVILSVCPPSAAEDVAAAVGRYDGIYVDANAVSPETTRRIATRFDRFVDGGIVGAPPRADRTVRLYLSGRSAGTVAELFARSPVETVILGDEIGSASALKMAYAAWSKGTAALVLGIRALARAENVEEPLVREWLLSVPGLLERSEQAARSAGLKGWRWVGEMEEIAATFAAADLPDGFHRAAAEVYRRTPRTESPVAADDLLTEVVDALLKPRNWG